MNKISFLLVLLSLLLGASDSFSASDPTTQTAKKKIFYSKQLGNNRELTVTESDPVAFKMTIPKLEFLKYEGGTSDMVEVEFKLRLKTGVTDTELWSCKHINSAALGNDQNSGRNAFRILDVVYFGEQSFCVLFASNGVIYAGVANTDKTIYAPSILLLQNNAGGELNIEKGAIVGNLKDKTLAVHLENTMKNNAVLIFKIAVGFTVTQQQ